MTRILKPFLVALGVLALLVAFFRINSMRSFDRKSAVLVKVKEVLKLALLEVQVSQIYEGGKDLKIMTIPIPFTEQKSLIVAEGKALLGYDLQSTDIDILSRKIMLYLPEPVVLSLDLDYRVVFENDYFFNRILPEDRNQMFLKIKSEVRASLLSEVRKKNLKDRLAELMKSVLHEFEIQIKEGGHRPPSL